MSVEVKVTRPSQVDPDAEFLANIAWYTDDREVQEDPLSVFPPLPPDEKIPGSPLSPKRSTSSHPLQRSRSHPTKPQAESHLSFARKTQSETIPEEDGPTPLGLLRDFSFKLLGQGFKDRGSSSLGNLSAPRSQDSLSGESSEPQSPINKRLVSIGTSASSTIRSITGSFKKKSTGGKGAIFLTSSEDLTVRPRSAGGPATRPTHMTTAAPLSPQHLLSNPVGKGLARSISVGSAGSLTSSSHTQEVAADPTRLNRCATVGDSPYTEIQRVSMGSPRLILPPPPPATPDEEPNQSDQSVEAPAANQCKGGNAIANEKGASEECKTPTQQISEPPQTPETTPLVPRSRQRRVRLDASADQDQPAAKVRLEASTDKDLSAAKGNPAAGTGAATLTVPFGDERKSTTIADFRGVELEFENINDTLDKMMQSLGTERTGVTG
eukprot:comp23942_c7_seq1/m.42338 comp23942_c7_seq1/g.42338  ORF comp23942_c7_seq1/g.42338 comp23942_c7_seq1/m.42338 type:complete len:438 (-) comp23942_c7_seq1:150-1463(-)